MVAGVDYSPEYEEAHKEDFTTKRLVETTKGHVAVTAKFFDTYLEDGALENALIYLGACSSGADEVLAHTLIKKGASAVIANTASVSISYNNSMIHTFFKTLSTKDGNSYTTAVDALKAAKEEHGQYYLNNDGIKVYVTLFLDDDIDEYTLEVKAEGTLPTLQVDGEHVSSWVSSSENGYALLAKGKAYFVDKSLSNPKVLYDHYVEEALCAAGWVFLKTDTQILACQEDGSNMCVVADELFESFGGMVIKENKLYYVGSYSTITIFDLSSHQTSSFIREERPYSYIADIDLYDGELFLCVTFDFFDLLTPTAITLNETGGIVEHNSDFMPTTSYALTPKGMFWLTYYMEELPEGDEYYDMTYLYRDDAEFSGDKNSDSAYLSPMNTVSYLADMADPIKGQYYIDMYGIQYFEGLLYSYSSNMEQYFTMNLSGEFVQALPAPEGFYGTFRLLDGRIFSKDGERISSYLLEDFVASEVSLPGETAESFTDESQLTYFEAVFLAILDDTYIMYRPDNKCDWDYMYISNTCNQDVFDTLKKGQRIRIEYLTCEEEYDWTEVILITSLE